MPTREWTPTPTDTQASDTTNQLSDELLNDNTTDNSQGISMASTTGVTEMTRDENDLNTQGAKRKRDFSEGSADLSDAALVQVRGESLCSKNIFVLSYD